jgi:hypothetical protein
MSSQTSLQLLKPERINPLMDALIEPNLPIDISWIPNAVGWYWLLFVLVCVIAFQFYKRLDRYLANAYRRAALLELSNLSLSDDIDKLPQLLRRTALYAYSRRRVASLVGTDWELWLDSECQGCQFSTQFRGVLAKLSYAPSSEFEESTLLEVIQQIKLWIEEHRGTYDRV